MALAFAHFHIFKFAHLFPYFRKLCYLKGDFVLKTPAWSNGGKWSWFEFHTPFTTIPHTKLKKVYYTRTDHLKMPHAICFF